MKPFGLAWLLTLGLVSGCATKPAPRWSVQMNMAHSCCCAAICPCIVGSAPTRGYCHDNMLVEIQHGQYNGVSLDGVTLVMVEEMRKWRHYYVSDRATAEQADAIVALFRELPFKVEKVLSVERVPLTVTREPERIRYSTPQSIVEIEPLKGSTGKPVTVQNTILANYVQYRSITNRYAGPDNPFQYSGTQGATFSYAAASKN